MSKARRRPFKSFITAMELVPAAVMTCQLISKVSTGLSVSAVIDNESEIKHKPTISSILVEEPIQIQKIPLNMGT